MSGYKIPGQFRRKILLSAGPNFEEIGKKRKCCLVRHNFYRCVLLGVLLDPNLGNLGEYRHSRLPGYRILGKLWRNSLLELVRNLRKNRKEKPKFCWILPKFGPGVVWALFEVVSATRWSKFHKFWNFFGEFDQI